MTEATMKIPETPADLRDWAQSAEASKLWPHTPQFRDEAAAIARAYADALERLAEVERERDKARATAGKLFNEHMALIEKHRAALSAEAAERREAGEGCAAARPMSSTPT